MSRVGKKPIIIPAGVEAKIDQDQVTVKGPKGTLVLALIPTVAININGAEINVTVKKPEDKKQRSVWGLFRNLINNMVVGVTVGFSKQLEINGIGYKAAISGKSLILNVGYSHPVEYHIPEGIEIKVEKNLITISGFDKQSVGQTAADIRAIKKPEPYKGKGIRYAGEVVRRKAGKTAVKSQ